MADAAMADPPAAVPYYMDPQTLIQDLNIPTKTLCEIANAFSHEIEQGIQGNECSLDCLVTYLGPPSGTESGQFVAIDLGGTNLRVLLVKLGSSIKPEVIARTPDRMLTKDETTGTKKVLFGAIADAVQSLFKEYDIDRKTPIGFTFSFPAKQSSITESKIVRWSKQFEIKDGTGCDPVVELTNELEERGFEQPNIVAILNDTTGTLLTGAIEFRDCDIGMILATGTNICIELPADRVTKEASLKSNAVYINLESGNFDKKLPLKQHDKDLDAKPTTTNQGKQLLEKMVSGMYLGMLASHILTEFHKKDMFLREVSDTEAEKKLSKMTSKHMSDIIQKPLHSDNAREVMGALGFDRNAVNDQDVELLQDLVQGLLARSARLSAACIWGVVQQIEVSGGAMRQHTVAIDGSLFQKSPGYKEMMEQVLIEMLGKARADMISLKELSTGSVIGAAIAAAVAVRPTRLHVTKTESAEVKVEQNDQLLRVSNI